MQSGQPELEVREGLAREVARAWTRLASPGTWWTGAERLAIAACSRAARQCPLCRTRKAALSPYGIDGVHHGATSLDPALVDVVHRITTDAGRLRRRYVESAFADGITEPQYVEAVGVIALVTALDTFDRALGLGERPLPAPLAGEPSRWRPAGEERGFAWVPTCPPEALAGQAIDPYPVHGAKNIHRALSLVPQEVFHFFDLDVELYLWDQQIRDFDHEYRALTHPQMELVAGRVSALNGCYY